MFRIGGTATQTYPAGGNPWNGNLVQVRPNYTIFTPAQVPAAEELNFFFAGMSDAAATGVSVPGCSWQADVTAGSGLVINTGGINAICAAFFDSIDIRWLVAVSDGNVAPNYNWVYSNDGLGGGYTIVDSGAGIAATGHITAICFDGTHYFATFIRDSDGAGMVFTCTPGGAWSATVTDTASTYGDGVLNIFGGQVVATFSPTGGGTPYAKSFYTPANSAISWGASLIGASHTADGLLSAASPTLLVVFVQSYAATQYSTSTDGTTWTNRTIPGSLLTHGDFWQGLCYSPADGAFVLVSYGADSKMHTYVSYDGLTWGEQGVGIAGPAVVCGLAATNSGCLLANSTQTGAIYPLYSVDCGLTWHWSQVQAPAPGFTVKTQPKVASSPTGFFTFNNSHGRFSHNAGFGAAIT